MANRFPDEQCVICDAPSVGVGEHVWPTWFLQEFAGEGPFYTEKSGQPIRKRDGDVATHNALEGAHVPMCEECNGLLSKHIEEPAKDIIRKLLPRSADHAWPSLSSDECAAVAFWFLKVGLLLSHPKVHHDNPRLNKDPDVPRLPDLSPEYLTWMRAGATPPYGFSVYAYRRSLKSEIERWPNGKTHIALPTLVRVGEHELRFMARELGIRGIDVTIVWHPGWPIAHPLVDSGRAVELWPRPAGADFDRMPEVHSGEFGFATGGTSFVFRDDEYQEHLLPPLAPDLNFGSVLEYVTRQASDARGDGSASERP